LIKVIELCDEGQDMPDLSAGKSSSGHSGVKFAYPADHRPATHHEEPTNNNNTNNQTENIMDLADLMSKLKSL
jgi:hypothetical protein